MIQSIEPLGDSAIIVRLGDKVLPETNRKVRALCRLLDEGAIPAVVEYVPAFTNVTIYYDVRQVAASITDLGSNRRNLFEQFCSWVRSRIENIRMMDLEPPKKVEIPVCYGGEYGVDLEEVASHNGITSEEVIEIHSSAEYLVYMIGFAPGFPYLGGLSARIATPRRATPRLAIPAGSVGIAGKQTGIYPLESPGGWQLIGRTPLPLFLPHRNPPTLLETGNIVKFKPISEEEFIQLSEENMRFAKEKIR